MLWPAVETALKSHIETQWAVGSYPTVKLLWEGGPSVELENEEPFVFITIDGTYSDKGIYGGTGKRSSVEGGIVLFSAFVTNGAGRALATALAQEMTSAIELQRISTSIYADGGNPPSPADSTDINIPGGQPGGSYYRVAGSVPFIVTGAR